MSFLPDDYQAPPSESKYLKLEQGQTTFRILSDSITGFVGWTQDNKPQRSKLKDDLTGLRDIKHFWAFVVWNHKTESIQIAEITQKGIQNAILSLYENKLWGDPKEYALTITRTGEGMETKYSVMPNPKAPLEDLMIASWKDNPPMLSKLFTGEDPWELTPEEKQKLVESILPF